MYNMDASSTLTMNQRLKMTLNRLNSVRRRRAKLEQMAAALKYTGPLDDFEDPIPKNGYTYTVGRYRGLEDHLARDHRRMRYHLQYGSPDMIRAGWVDKITDAIWDTSYKNKLLTLELELAEKHRTNIGTIKRLLEQSPATVDDSPEPTPKKPRPSPPSPDTRLKAKKDKKKKKKKKKRKSKKNKNGDQ